MTAIPIELLARATPRQKVALSHDVMEALELTPGQTVVLRVGGKRAAAPVALDPGGTGRVLVGASLGRRLALPAGPVFTSDAAWTGRSNWGLSSGSSHA